MSPQQKFYWLIGGIGGLLVSASIIGMILRSRAGSAESHAVIDNLNARIRAWWVMVAIFSAAFMIGTKATLVMFALISFFALREFITLTPTKAADHQALSLAFFALIPGQYWLIGVHWYALFAVFIPVYAFLMLPALSALAQALDSHAR